MHEQGCSMQRRGYLEGQSRRMFLHPEDNGAQAVPASWHIRSSTPLKVGGVLLQVHTRKAAAANAGVDTVQLHVQLQ